MFSYELLTISSLEGALDYLDRCQGVKILAGGTDLLVDMQKGSDRLSGFAYLLDISNIKELNYITKNAEKDTKVVKRDTENAEGDTDSDTEQGWTRIGALTTHTSLMENQLLHEQYSLLPRAASFIGSTQIRNRGTVGGNICNASPAADLLPPLLAYRAEVVLQSVQGRRILPLSSFLPGPYQTNIREKEILTDVRLPALEDGLHYYSSWQRIGRRKAVTIARLSTAVIMGITGKGVIRDVRIVPGSATPVPCSFTGLEHLLLGSRLAEIDIEKIGSRAGEEMMAISGERWSTPYKKLALAALVSRAVREIQSAAEQDIRPNS